MHVPGGARDSGPGDWAVEMGKVGGSGDPGSASCAFLPSPILPGPGVPMCKAGSQGELVSRPFWPRHAMILVFAMER